MRTSNQEQVTSYALEAGKTEFSRLAGRGCCEIREGKEGTCFKVAAEGAKTER